MAAADPKRRSQNARIAALSRWSKEDPREGTRPAREGRLAAFARRVDPDGTLPGEERDRRARCAMRAEMARIGRLPSRRAAAARARRAA